MGMKKVLFAIGMAAVLAAGAPTVATARDGGHWHGGHHWRGGGFWRGPGIAFGFGLGAPYYAYGSCYQARRVWTPYGWRWRRTWVC
jgi:hypothetical protein